MNVRSLTLDGQTAGGSTSHALGLAALVGVLSLGGLFGLARLRESAGVTVALGMMAGLLVIGMDAHRLAETLRLIESSEDWLPLWMSGFCSVFGVALWGSIHLARTRALCGRSGPALPSPWEQASSGALSARWDGCMPCSLDSVSVPWSG